MTEWEAHQRGQGPNNPLAAAQTAFTDADKRHTEAAAELYRFETRSRRLQSWALPALVVGLFVLGFSGVSLASQKPGGSRQPYYLASIALFVLGAAALGAAVMTRGTDAAETAWDQKLKERRDAEKQVALAEEARELAANERFDDRRAGANAAPMMAAPRGGADFGGAKIAPRAPAPPMMAPGMAPRPADPEPKAGAKPADAKLDTPMAGGKFDQGKQLAAKARGTPADAMQRERAKLADALADKRNPQAGQGGFGRPVRRWAQCPRRNRSPAAGRSSTRRASSRGPCRPRCRSWCASTPTSATRRSATCARTSPKRCTGTRSSCCPRAARPRSSSNCPTTSPATRCSSPGTPPTAASARSTKTIEARKPFSVDPKLPLEVSHTDVIDVPVRVTNDSGEKRNVAFTTLASGFKADGSLADCARPRLPTARAARYFA